MRRLTRAAMAARRRAPRVPAGPTGPRRTSRPHRRPPSLPGGRHRPPGAGLVVPDGKGKVPTRTAPTGRRVRLRHRARTTSTSGSRATRPTSGWPPCRCGASARPAASARCRTRSRASSSPGTTIKILPGRVPGRDRRPRPRPRRTRGRGPPAPHRLRRPAGGAHLRPAVRLPDHPERWSASSARPTCRSRASGPSPRTWSSTPAFGKPYGIRVDRSPGIYLRNLTVQHATASAVYVLESDGFVLDDVTARWNDEYGLRMLADRPRPRHRVRRLRQRHRRHRRLRRRPTSTPPTGSRTARYPIEVRHCDSHENLIGFAGSAGDSVWVHDALFSGNTVGIATDSRRPPARPAAEPRRVRAATRSRPTTANYYNYVRDGTCAKPSAQRGYEQGVVCPTRRAAGRHRRGQPGRQLRHLADNWVYDNAYAGFVMGWAPAYFRGEPHVTAQFDTSHHNRVFDNQLGVRPNGDGAPNGIDVWWDGQGVGSCWQAPVGRLGAAGAAALRRRRPADRPRHRAATCPSPARRSPCTCAPATTWPRSGSRPTAPGTARAGSA